MPKVKANNLTMNYDQQGTGEPLILIPYLTADHACYAFQVAEYAKQWLAENGCVPKRRHRGFPGNGQSDGECSRDGDSCALPMVPYA